MNIKHAARLALVLAAAMTAAPASCAEQTANPVPVYVLHLASARSQTQYHYFGTVQGSQRVNLSFRVAGPLIEFPIELGMQVKKGDLIGRIDPRDFRTQLSEAQSQLSQAKAKYTQAQNDFKRYEELYKNKVISQMQYDRYRTAFDVTRSSVRTAEANVSAAQNALADTELRAPFDGHIVERMVENYQDVQAKQPIVSLQHLETIEVVFNIPEEDIANIAVEDESSKTFHISDMTSLEIGVTLDALPGQSFKASSKEVGAQSDPRTRTYPVTVTMKQPETVPVLPGMSAHITVSLSSTDGTKGHDFYVPMAAVTGDMSQNIWVWRCSREGSIEKVPVTLGDFRGDRIQVTGDLNPGDIIVTSGARGLVEGQTVTVID